MIWHLIKYWIAFILPSFYRRIQGKNVKNIKVEGPVIIAMNHPNAFTDPIAISYISYPVRLKYMARGDAFKPGLVAWLLEQIGIVPIYRLQDGGIEGLKKNDAAYKRVNQLLRKNAKIIVFAEGLCVQERRLRPLKKGVARMVFGAYEAINDPRLSVVPIGVNYSQPDKFRSDVFYNIGEPILVKDFISQFHENPARANNALLQVLEPRMKELITHINDKNYDEVVVQVETLCKHSELKRQGLNAELLENDFVVLKQLTEKVNVGVTNNQAIVDEFKIKAKDYFSELKQNNLRDWLLDPTNARKVNLLNLSKRLLILVLCFPIFSIGLVGNYLPFKLTEKIARKIVGRKKEFYSSIVIGISMVLFLLNYLLWFVLFTFLAPNLLVTLIICSLIAMCGGCCLFYYPYLIKTIGMARVLQHKDLAANLLEKRKFLISLINKF